MQDGPVLFHLDDHLLPDPANLAHQALKIQRVTPPAHLKSLHFPETHKPLHTHNQHFSNDHLSLTSHLAPTLALPPSTITLDLRCRSQ